MEKRMANIAFTINGKAVSVEAEPDTPLLGSA
jgi:aerobic-type carbon monoxide dehydrogenase small subunit (CoxS/CutS family)